ncbi:MAG: DNA-3-methyladenine glycosylase [Ignavibacteriota bacterium]|nr:DNA-3-methyladenine glycosylase [Ignavibacteriota bacterium]MCO6447752.1 DNA-3-methyladenine glycosylase [Ignavibacterium album]QKK00057.1 MAG: DNA-3-methyladenine glycosylase [Ignavibacteriota bacterium]HMN17714.1 DNA-3-methyladenine glycosylase [Ignavibacteriaceae bacterium]HOJ07977.1 DNA-3-methyladenine glycosylase [Ignavibacteriaceae bacterium]
MFDTSKKLVLPKKFYIRPVLAVAKDLLGKVLIKTESKKMFAGRIVEVEAYDGSIDEASHSYNGKTKRNEVMFNTGGCLYVYFTYGAHFCSNIVTGKEGYGNAVLIRAVEPLAGIDYMIVNRFNRELKSEKELCNLTSGPGKVSKAFGFDSSYSGMDLTNSSVYLLDQPRLNSNKIGISKRIGITRSVDLPWRFFEIGNPYLSR